MLMTVGIDFCIANTLQEAAQAQKYVKFDEKLHNYLQNKKSNFTTNLDVLLNLDPYGDKLFSAQEINELIDICQDLLSEYQFPLSEYRRYYNEEQKVREFTSELKELCIDALKKSKLVYAIGD